MPALMRMSFWPLTGAGIPTMTSRPGCRRRSRRAQSEVTFASKQIWVITWVAYGALTASAVQFLVGDGGVPFRIAADADVRELVSAGADRHKQRSRVREFACRPWCVTADHEDAPHPRRVQPGQQVRQLLPVGDKPGGQVRGHLVAAGGQPLGQADGGLDSAAFGRGDGERDVRGHVRRYGVLGALERHHLEGDVGGRVPLDRKSVV